MNEYNNIALSDREFHKKIINKFISGKKKIFNFPVLIYNIVPRSTCNLKNEINIFFGTYSQKRSIGSFPTFKNAKVEEKLSLFSKDIKRTSEKNKNSNTRYDLHFFKNYLTLENIIPEIFHKFASEAGLQINSLKGNENNAKKKRLRTSFKKDAAPQISDFIKKSPAVFVLSKSFPLGSFLKNNSQKNFFSSHLFDSYLNNIIHSEKIDDLFTPPRNQIISCSRTIQRHHPHQHESSNLDLEPALKISEAQIFDAGNKVSNLSYRREKEFSDISKSLVFHTPPDIQQQIEQRFMKLNKDILLAKETITEQSKTFCSQFERDLKHQLEITKISDQVYRQIDRRLKIECERRGIL